MQKDLGVALDGVASGVGWDRYYADRPDDYHSDPDDHYHLCGYCGYVDATAAGCPCCGSPAGGVVQSGGRVLRVRCDDNGGDAYGITRLVGTTTDDG